jgi:ankyrin repeat protein
MSELTSNDDSRFRGAVEGLRAGDFTRLGPLFSADSSGAASACAIVEWVEAGRFDDDAAALAEALTCACFLGRTSVAEYLLGRGVRPSGGAGTGLDALHWAANRGQVDAVRLLIAHAAPVETRSMYGGTVLGTAVWAAINEPRGEQLAVIEALLEAGAEVEEAGYPTGNDEVDDVLRRHGALR